MSVAIRLALKRNGDIGLIPIEFADQMPQPFETVKDIETYVTEFAHLRRVDQFMIYERRRQNRAVARQKHTEQIDYKPSRCQPGAQYPYGAHTLTLRSVRANPRPR